MRSYNQFKTQEKKLKKELERSLADLTGRIEKQAQSTEDLTNFLGKDVDGYICKIVEDHKYEMSLIIEKYNQEHQTLINQKK